MAVFNSGNSISSSAGTCTVSTPATGTTATNVLAANSSRKRFLVFNPTTNTQIIYLGFAASVTAANGIPLAPGQGWEDSSQLIHTGVISALAASGTPNLIVYEWQ